MPEEHEITEADQELALRAIRSTERVQAPESLRVSVARMAAPPARRPVWRRPMLAGGAVAALAAVVVAVVLVLSGGSGPTVAQASRVALAPPVAGPPARKAGSEELDVTVDGVAYPYWDDTGGWRAVGTRRDVVDGRDVTSVVYADDRGRRIGYAIAAGDALPASGGRAAGRFRVLRVGGADVVTWERGGRTCILASRDVGSDVMLRLAATAT
jgi:hypothetical protein